MPTEAEIKQEMYKKHSAVKKAYETLALISDNRKQRRGFEIIAKMADFYAKKINQGTATIDGKVVTIKLSSKDIAQELGDCGYRTVKAGVWKLGIKTGLIYHLPDYDSYQPPKRA